MAQLSPTDTSEHVCRACVGLGLQLGLGAGPTRGELTRSPIGDGRRRLSPEALSAVEGWGWPDGGGSGPGCRTLAGWGCGPLFCR